MFERGSNPTQFPPTPDVRIDLQSAGISETTPKLGVYHLVVHKPGSAPNQVCVCVCVCVCVWCVLRMCACMSFGHEIPTGPMGKELKSPLNSVAVPAGDSMEDRLGSLRMSPW